MLKYYIALFIIAGIVLFNVYSQDPCNKVSRTEFSSKHPDYKILDSVAGNGTPEFVQCHIYYNKPDIKSVFKDIWQFQNKGNGWEFSEIIVEGEMEPTR